jgi:hypothetical protein
MSSRKGKSGSLVTELAVIDDLRTERDALRAKVAELWGFLTVPSRQYLARDSIRRKRLLLSLKGKVGRPRLDSSRKQAAQRIMRAEMLIEEMQAYYNKRGSWAKAFASYAKAHGIKPVSAEQAYRRARKVVGL